MPQTTYLTTDELSARIKYDDRTIRERLKEAGPRRDHQDRQVIPWLF